MAVRQAFRDRSGGGAKKKLTRSVPRCLVLTHGDQVGPSQGDHLTQLLKATSSCQQLYFLGLRPLASYASLNLVMFLV